MSSDISFAIPRKSTFSFEFAKTALTSATSGVEVAKYLNEQFSEDFGKAEDLLDWGYIVNLILKTLTDYYGRMNAIIGDDTIEVAECKFVCKSILVFLCRLLRSAKDKRYFQALSDIEPLMKSPDLEICELAFELFFYLCVPASSISSNSRDDWADSIEIPTSISKTAAIAFFSLAGNDRTAGVLSFLRNNSPIAQSDIAAEHGIDINSNEEKAFQLNLLQAMQQSATGTAAEREKLVVIRLYSFFIMVHSKLPANGLQEYLKTNTSFIPDLVSLSDVTTLGSLNIEFVSPLLLSHVALENLLGLIESRLRRRSVMTFNTNVLELMDLERDAMHSPSSVNNEDIWISIITSACSLSHYLLSGETASTNTIMPRYLANSSFVQSSTEQTKLNMVGKFTRLGLELYALAFTTREPTHVIIDIRLIHTVIALLQSMTKELRILLVESQENVSVTTVSNQKVQVMLVIAKILYCMELTVEKSGYTNAFRECNGLVAISNILETFAEYSYSIDHLIAKFPYFSTILETALSVVNISVQKFRPSATTAARTLSESGYVFFFSKQFVELGRNILSSFSSACDLLWSEFIQLIKEFINFEPPYLAHFLNSELASEVETAFVKALPLRNTAGGEGQQQRVDLDCLLTPVAKFALSVCITAEGKAFLFRSNIIEFLIEAIQHPLAVVPQSYGLGPEKLAKLGQLVSEILIEHEAIKTRLKYALKRTLTELLRQVDIKSSDSEFMCGIESNSPRVQLLQRLYNFCTFTEQLFLPEIRRHQADIVRDVLADNLNGLFKVYQMCLPPQRQLFAQISIRSSTAYQTYGHTQCIKAITSLIKASTSFLSTELMEKLFALAEETVHDIATLRLSLIGLDRESSSSGSGRDSAAGRAGFNAFAEAASTADSTIPGKPVKNNRRKRGSSFGNQTGTMTHITGALDAIPGITMINPAFEELSEEVKQQMWLFANGTIKMEWLSLLIGHVLRLLYRSSDRNQIATVVDKKENLRHLFSFFKSSYLEVARFVASTLGPKHIQAARIKGPLENLLFETVDNNKDNLTFRIPETYRLRVFGNGGALVREGIELDDSRVVFVAEVGSEVMATERRVNSAGLIRYRTSLGWISEYRRDQSKSPIVELLDIFGVGKVPNSDTTTTAADEDALYLFTMREGICFLMSRLNQSLRHVSNFLSRLTTSGSESRSFTPNSFHFQLSSSICNYFKGFLEFATEKDGESEGRGPAAAAATMCLYYSSTVKNVINSAMEDKNGNWNLLLFRTFCNHGLIENILRCLEFSFDTLSNELAKFDWSNNQQSELKSEGRSALVAISTILAFLRKIVNRDIFNKSITARTAVLQDEHGSFQAFEFLHQIMMPIAEWLYRACTDCRWTKYPADIQCEMLSINADILGTLSSSLPEARPSRTSDSGLVPPNNNSRFAEYGRSSFRREQPSQEELIERLTDMGFPHEDIIRGLSVTHEFNELYELLIGQIDSRPAPAINTAPGTVQSSAAVAPPPALEQQAPVAAPAENAAAAAAAVLPPPPPPTATGDEAIAAALAAAVAAATMPVAGITAEEAFMEARSSSADSLPNLVSALSLWTANQNELPLPPSARSDGSNMMMSMSMDSSTPPQPARSGAAASFVGSGPRTWLDFTAARSRQTNARREAESKAVAAPAATSPLSPENTYRKYTEEFRGTAHKLRLRIADIAGKICMSFDIVVKWDIKDSFYLFGQLRDFLAAVGKDRNIVFVRQTLDEALQAVEDLLSKRASAQLFGYFVFASMLAKSSSFTTEYMQVFPYPRMVQHLSLLSDFLRDTISSSSFTDAHTDCLAASLVFMSTLVSRICAHESFIDEQLNLLLKSSTANSKDEGKEEEGSLAEAKETESTSLSGELSIKTAMQQTLSTLLMILDQGHDAKFSARACSALMDNISQIVLFQPFAKLFVAENGVNKVLALRKAGDKNALAIDDFSQETFGKLVQRLFETSAVLQADFRFTIKSFFSALNGQESRIGLEKFLRGHALQISRSPEDFWAVCIKLLKFHKSSMDTEAATTVKKTFIFVSLQEVVQEEVVFQPKDFDRSSYALQSVLTYVSESLAKPTSDVEESKPFISGVGSLGAICDAALLVRNGATVLSAALKSYAQQTHNERFLDDLLATAFKSVDNNEVVQAVTRFFLTLAAHRGVSRALSLSAIVRVFETAVKTFSTEQSVAHAGLLDRLCKLIVLAVQATKASHPMTPGEKKQEQTISVETVAFFLRAGALLEQITEALLLVSLTEQALGPVVVSLLTMLELFTRPRLLCHLEANQITASKVDEAKTQLLDAAQENEELFGRTTDTTTSATAAGGNGAETTEERTRRAVEAALNNVMLGEAHHQDDEDFNGDHQHHPEEDEEGEEMDDGEDGDGGDDEELMIAEDEEDPEDEDAEDEELDEGEDEEGEGEDDEVGDEEEYDHGEDYDTSHIDHPDLHIEELADADITVENFEFQNMHSNDMTAAADRGMASLFQDAFPELADIIQSEYDRGAVVRGGGGDGGNSAIASVREGFEAADDLTVRSGPAAGSNMDRDRNLEILMESMGIVSGEDRGNAASSFLANMLRRAQPGAVGGTVDLMIDAPGGAVSLTSGGGSGNASLNRFATNDILPMGLQAALDVRRDRAPISFFDHNSAAQQQLRLQHQQNQQRILSTAGGPFGVGFPIPMPPQSAAMMSALGGGVGGPPGARTVIHFSSGPGGTARSMTIPHGDFFGGGDETGFPDDPDATGGFHLPGLGGAMPAHWPGYSMARDTSNATEAAPAVDLFASRFHERVEGMLLQELDQEPSSNDGEERSITGDSASAASRSNDVSLGQSAPASLPSTSLQAVQDPNPRRHGEDDSVSYLGGPIPPLIEIESRDNEANEDMSVLTLPQDNAGDWDNQTVHTRLTTQQGDDRSTPGPGTVNDDDQETIRTFPPIEEEDDDDDDDNNHNHDGLDEEEEQSHSQSQSQSRSQGDGSGSAAGDYSTGFGSATSDAAVDHLAEDIERVDLSISPAPMIINESMMEGHELPPSADISAHIANVVSAMLQDISAIQPVTLDAPTTTAAAAAVTGAAETAEDTVQVAPPQDGGEAGGEGALVCPPGYDSDVFYSLPPDMQQEVIDQHGETTDSTRELAEAAGYDYETLMSLPDDIRQEVLDQARRQRSAEAALQSGGAPAAAEQEMDNASFLASLTLELRTEVLMTADQQFLATLPPEIAAEAQTLRERAASHWQRREIIAQAAGAAAAGGGHGNAAAIAPPAGWHHEYEFEEDEDEEDDTGGWIPPRGGRRGGTGVAADRQAVTAAKRVKVRNGLLSIPATIKVKITMPVNMLLGVCRAMLSKVKRSSTYTEAVLRVLHNICQSLPDKYNATKLLTGLITNERGLIASALISVGDTETAVSSLFATQRDDSKPRAAPIPILSSSCANATSIADDQQPQQAGEEVLELSAVASRRVVFILTSLCAENSGFTLTTLFPRATTDWQVTFPEDGVEVVRKGETHQAADGHSRGLSVLSASSEEVKSTESLFEMIIRAVPRVLMSNHAVDLESIALLIEQLTLPLDLLPDDSSTDRQPVIADEIREKDIKNKTITIPVPTVICGRETLGNLCEVLLSDLCNQRVFTLITSSLSRLARTRSNNTVLTELIFDVISDLSGHTHSKLDSFADSLRLVSPSTRKASVAGPSTTNTLAAIPMEDIGHRLFDRFLRLIQTLQTMSERKQRSLYDVAPVEALIQVWNSLDVTLTTLQGFAIDEDGTEVEGLKTNPQVTAIVATLRRLLPLIESFFMVHTSDLLNPPAAAVTAATATATAGTPAAAAVEGSAAAEVPPAEATSAVETAEGQAAPTEATAPAADPAVADGEIAPVVVSPAATTSSPAPGGDPAAVAKAATQQASSKIPGQRFRTSKEYQRANISLPFMDGLSSASSSGLGLLGGPASPTAAEGMIALSRVRSIPMDQQLSSVSSGNRYRRLVAFCANHRALLNTLIHSKPGLLESSLASMMRVVQLRPHVSFDNKRRYFFSRLRKAQQQSGYNARRGAHIQIRRQQVFEDSYHQLRGRTAEELGGRLQINFYGEEGVDAGGLTREWYLILSREIFNPNYALFMACADNTTFQPNPLSMVNSNHLDYFKFVGRIIGKALCDQQLMDAHFTRSFYKHLLGLPIEFVDIEATEPDYYKSLQMMLASPLEDLGFGGTLTFTAEIQRFGRTEDVELIPNGANILVTDENKAEYVRLMAHHRMTAGISPQIDAFLSGFYDLVPPELVCIFSPTELELLICGLPEVNIEELRQQTEYHQYRAGDDVIVWFWDALRSFNREERALFLQFVTGTSKVPLGGFSQLQGMRGTQRFTIHRAYGGETGVLPTAHTCYNQLDLPAYDSPAELREKLLMAIKEGSEGFGFA